MANEYQVSVYACPSDEELGYPRYKSGSEFVATDFMESLYGGVFPEYMIVEFIGDPFHAPGVSGTLWTVGPHPFRKGRQALFEYFGDDRVLAPKPKKPSTLIDITRSMAEGTEYYTFTVEIVIEAESETDAASTLQGILSDYETADGTLIDWGYMETNHVL